jgi:hypothetical protein
MSTTGIRDTLNSGNPNVLGDAAQAIGLGELLSLMIATAGAGAPTDTLAGGDIVSSLATLAAVPTALFYVNGTVGTHTGVKKLRKGPVSGPNALVPATGECVWDGGLHILFASVDAITTATVLYATASDLASITMADLARG